MSLFYLVNFPETLEDVAEDERQRLIESGLTPSKLAMMRKRNGIYSVSMHSIDGVIFELGDGLTKPGIACKAAGLQDCTGPMEVELRTSKPGTVVPVFGVATTESLKAAGSDVARCAGRYSARVTYVDGETYFAGPPQSYGTTDEVNECRFMDRSGTALTLVAELVELKEAPIEPSPSSFLITN